jgi:ubiquinone biosynthesis protein
VIRSELLSASVPGVILRIVLGLLLAAVVTALSLRLLGIRRGWMKALAAGTAGWTIAGLVALAVSDWDWDANGLALQIVAIAIPTTMAVAVALDLLARPGTLATGDRAGLVVAARPLRAIKRRISVLRRYRELLGLLRREGFGPLIKSTDRAERTAERTGVRLRRVLQDAGGVYIKLGQIAATRVDLLPADVCADLATLQNRAEPVPSDEIALVLEAELGAHVDEVFAEFDWSPLAAASIGQTHVARLTTGEVVVVKVQRPGINDLMERDLAALALLANLAQRRTPFGRELRSGDLVEQFAKSLREELDFRREADAMLEMASGLTPGSGVRVPIVYRKLCTRRILVQERFEGTAITDADELDPDHRARLAGQLLSTTIDQVMKRGFFHADPHPGNIFALDDGSLGLIDFGAVGRLGPIEQRAIVEMFFALSRRDVGLLREAVVLLTGGTETASDEELERAFGRLLAEHVRPGSGTVDSAVLQELVATLSRLGLRLPGDVVLLSRALVTVDGTMRALSPTMTLMGSMVELMEPSKASEVIDRQELMREEILNTLPHLRRLPERVDRLLTQAGRGELRLRSVVDEDSRRILRTLVNRALLVLIGASFLLVSTLLLVSADDGPAVGDDTGLYEIFGYGGLLAGMVLLLRVVGAVARDGTT